MKQELLQLPNGEEITRDDWAQRESLEVTQRDCECIDCGGDQPGHSSTCSWMMWMHGEPEWDQPTNSELYESDEYADIKRIFHYIGFNVLCFGALLLFALLCPKCSDADDRAKGLPQQPTTTR